MSQHNHPSASDRASRWVWGALAILLVAATVGLWARHGTSVFAELLIAGWTACFG